MAFTLSVEQYEGLIALARAGASTPDRLRDLEMFLELIEKANGITRYKLWVQWQETDSPVPPQVEFPETWPPEWRAYIEMVSRPIARTDVNALLALKARRPVGVLVTPDPGAVLGWTPIDRFFSP